MASKRCLTCHEQIPATEAQRNRGRCTPCWQAFRNQGYDSPAYQINRGTVLRRAQGRCEQCSAPFTAAKPEVHHLTPLTAGGTNHPTNLIALCHDCHTTTHHRGGGGQ